MKLVKRKIKTFENFILNPENPKDKQVKDEKRKKPLPVPEEDGDQEDPEEDEDQEDPEEDEDENEIIEEVKQYLNKYKKQ